MVAATCKFVGFALLCHADCAAAISRRTCVLAGAVCIPAAATTSSLAAAAAATTIATTASARARAYPPLEYLEPIYELKLSLDALGAVAAEPARWGALKKRLEGFFGGGLLSERMYYAGLSLQYIDKIQYDDLDFAVKTDKAQRREAMEDALNSLEACKRALEQPSPDAAAVAGAATAAQKGIERWLSLAPASDVQAVDRLFRAVRAADKSLDGKLDAAELASLAPSDAAIWRARVTLVGD